MPNPSGTLNDSEVLSRILELLERAEGASRLRILQTIQTFYGADSLQASSKRSEPPPQRVEAGANPVSIAAFSENRSLSPKEFMLEKRPQTDVEKVACLAYYLTHYSSVEEFKTLDISKLNTDAAQIKFSNAAHAVDNASKAGFLISSTKGQKRISALGELYVQALPDRAAARDAISHSKPKRRSRAGSKNSKSAKS